MNPKYLVGPLPWAQGETPISESYAGFIDIRNESHHALLNQKSGSTFFWLFPAQEREMADAPLIIWLQGGPGSSSMIGLFQEMGPMKVSNGKLLRNPDSWNLKYNMLFIDNPLGTGFSFVGNRTGKVVKEPEIERLTLKDAKAESIPPPTCETEETDVTPKWSPEGYVKNQAAVAHDLIVFLDRFYQYFPQLKDTSLYLTGESYAGKYVPALAYHIHMVNEKRDASIHPARPRIPLKGIAVGNGLTDPMTQIMAHSTQALSLGLVGEKVASQMYLFAIAAQSFICKKEYKLALQAREALFNLFSEASGGVNFYDIRKRNHSYNRTNLNAFLNDPATKKSLNIGEDTVYGKDWYLFPNLENDIMKSSAYYFPLLLENDYKVLLYQGQFDFRDGVLSQSDWIDSIHWKYIARFRDAERRVWSFNDELAGYYQWYKNLVQVTVLDCGHLCPGDVGSTRDMIDKFLV